MPMPKTLYDVLSEKLKDSKLTVDGKEVAVLDLVAGWQDAAEAKEKVQLANKEISTERDQLREELKTAKKTISEKDGEVERLQKNALTDEDKKNLDQYKKKGMTTEVEGKINTLVSQIEDIKNKLTAAETEKKTAMEQAAIARRQSAETKLRTDLTAALANAKIIKNAKFAVNSIIADGMAKVIEENGELKTTFTYFKDGKPFSIDGVESLVKEFAKENEQLVESSGNRGSGADTGQRGGGNQTGNPLTQAKTLAELRDAAKDMMNRNQK